MPPWTSCPLYRTAAGATLVVALAVLLGAPQWLIVASLLAAAVLFSIVAIRMQQRDLRVQEEMQQALDRLAAMVGADPGTPARTMADLPTRLETLADELAGKLDAAEQAHELAAGRLSAFPEPTLVIDPSDIIQSCNSPAYELLGLPCGRVAGRGIEDVFTHADLLRIIAQARRGGTVRVQIRVPTQEGMRVWDVAAAPAPPGNDVVLALRDATDEARALQVKTDFVGNASHELRTPIAALRAAVETLASLNDDDAAMRQRLIGMIANNVARLEEMARDLLDLSRIESPEAPVRIRDIKLSDFARDLSVMFEAICRERNISVVFDLAPELDHMRSDPDLLNLILRNLIDNATRFAFQGTAIRVVGRATGDRHPRGVRFEVIDRGPGIPLTSQQRIFERYFQVDTARTTSAHRRGSGLGLAIVKHAVRRLDGTIRVYSVWQQGTTMTVDLPDALTE